MNALGLGMIQQAQSALIGRPFITFSFITFIVIIMDHEILSSLSSALLQLP